MTGKDDIDFGRVRISKLFRKIFIPTLLGMVSWSLLTVADGIFVGLGVGSHGIASINICFPIFIVVNGFALMVGMGASVVASIHMSQNNMKAARINITQALLFTTILVLAFTVFVELFPTTLSLLLGASPTLLPFVRDYMVWLIPSGVMLAWSVIGLFIIRLDGSPKYAMWCNVVPALLNLVLDWLFIFPLNMGVKGAAMASSIATAVGGVMALIYLFFFAKRLVIYKLKTSLTAMRLMLRNVGYQCKIGLSALLEEATMAMLMVIGNIVFMKYLGNDGVAAFGAACYYLPFVFIFGNAIAQSAQPIISYNYGSGNNARVREVSMLSFRMCLMCSLLPIAAFVLFPDLLAHLFISSSDAASQIAVAGFPYFATGFLFFIFNLVAIGFFQSVERVVPATVFALLRGVVLPLPSFIVLPMLLGDKGIWLAMPLSEVLTFAIIAVYFALCRNK